MLELPGFAQAVEIEVYESKRPRLVHVDQRIGGTSHRSGNAAGPRETLHQGGLAGTEIAGQIEDGRLLKAARTCRGEACAERLGLIRRLQRFTQLRSSRATSLARSPRSPVRAAASPAMA